MKQIMILDEWIYLTSENRIEMDDKSRLLYRRYISSIDKCKNLKCEEFCSEFNVNEITSIFDGEVDNLNDLIQQVRQIV